MAKTAEGGILLLLRVDDSWSSRKNAFIVNLFISYTEI